MLAFFPTSVGFGGYLCSTIVARDLGLVSRHGASNGDGVVTPHASFLAMHHEPKQAYDNLVKLTTEFDAYGEGGFYDAIAVKSGTVAKRYLSLDQAMVLGSIGNVFGREIVRRYFAVGDVAKRVKPLLGMERFSL